MQGIPFPISLKNDIVNCFEYGMKMKTPSKIKLFLRFYKPVMLLFSGWVWWALGHMEFGSPVNPTPIRGAYNVTTLPLAHPELIA